MTDAQYRRDVLHLHIFLIVEGENDLFIFAQRPYCFGERLQQFFPLYRLIRQPFQRNLFPALLVSLQRLFQRHHAGRGTATSCSVGKRPNWL